MYHLATVFPFLHRYRLPTTRDHFMLFMVAVNEIFLGLEHYFAHLISGNIRPYEAVPIVFGPVAGVVLLVLAAIAFRWRVQASIGVTLVLMVSIVVGLVGWYIHILRAAAQYGPIGEQISINLLVWAPPFIAPLTSSQIGVIGIASAWKEDPLDSGSLKLPARKRLQLPISKAQLYFLVIGLGILATLISSVMDHARTGFENVWVWIPSAAGIFGTVVTIMMGFTDKPTRGELIVYILTMMMLILVGVVGAILHVLTDITTQDLVVFERFIRVAPPLAPLLFSDMGAFGLLVLLDPAPGTSNLRAP